jgi:hypothetical protein
VVTTGDTGTVTSAMIADATIVDGDISATAEIAVSKLADGSARQLLQTDAAGTGVEWTSNVDVPGTLDVTGAAVFDSSVSVTGALTKSGSNVVTVGDTGTVTSTMILDGTILNADINASAAIAGTKISPDFGSQNTTTTGTSTAASFIPTSSTAPTNGVYLPSANNVAISTNGTGRLFVDASGRIGLGTTPQEILDVNGRGRFQGSASSASSGAGLELAYVAGSTTGQILTYNRSTSAYLGTNIIGNPLTFSIGTTEAARLDSSGGFQFKGAGTAGVTQAVSFNGSAPINSLVIDSSGRVGLGTSSPGSKLEIVGTSGSAALGLVETGVRSWAIRAGGATTNKLDIADLTAGQTRLTIDSSGNLGIGTTSVGSTLHVKGGNGNQVYVDNDGSRYSGVEIRNNGADKAFVQYDNTDAIFSIGSRGSAAVRLLVAETEALRVDTSRRLLVGTSTDTNNIRIQQKLAIVTTGDGNFGGMALTSYVGSTLSTSRAPILDFNRSRGTTDGSFTKVESGDRLGIIAFRGADGSQFVDGAYIEAAVDGATSANDMPSRLVFSTTADGASSPTERMRINNSGNVGIGIAYTGAAVRLVTKGNGTSSAGYAFEAQDSGENTLLYCRNDGVISTGTRANSPYNLTTGSAANVHVDSNGILYRSTSSIRFKTSVETLDNQYADALLSCRPVWYRSTAPGDTLHPDWGYWGFIAEEVAEIDPRLVFWKTHETEKDEDGNTVQVELEEPIAEGVQYDRFVPHLLNLIKRQGEAIAELQAEVAALKGA